MNSGYPGDDGPFQANTRVVAVVALAVAGAFVLLGLVLSIARAMQQRTLDRLRAQAAQNAQNAQASGSQLMAAAGGVMRSSSSKVPHLVVGPDGIELFIAHKERIKSALQTDKIHIAPQALETRDQASLQQPALLSMTASTAGLLTSMHQNELGSLHSHAASSFQQPYGSSEWQISSSPLYTETQRQSTSQSTTPGSPTVDAHADAAQSAGEIGAQDYRRRHPEDAPARPLFTACVGTDYSL